MSLAAGVEALFRLSDADNVAVARTPLKAGEIARGAGPALACAEDVPAGFKVAVRAIAPGDRIIKYGAAIGSATRHIRAGEVVHLHNMKSDYIATHGRGDDAEEAAT